MIEGCHMVSAADPLQPLSRFLDRIIIIIIINIIIS